MFKKHSLAHRPKYAIRKVHLSILSTQILAAHFSALFEIFTLSLGSFLEK
jgi:hypothetical protein